MINILPLQEWQRPTYAHKRQSEHVRRYRDSRVDMKLEHRRDGDERSAAGDYANRAGHEKDDC